MPVPALEATPARPATARAVQATVCFTSLVGFTALSGAIGPERAYLAVTGCLRLLDAIARRHGAAVDKYQGDSLMLVFGHPVPLAHPARAAVAAALEMRRQVRDYDRALALPVRLALQTGIASGPLVAGDVGGRVVREFHVLGDTVNVAARLKAKAPPGAIRAEERTIAEAGERFAWSAPVSLALKGKSRPVPAADALGVRGPLATRGLAPEEAPATPLVGRDAEREQLRDALRALAGGRGGALALVGEPGSGRSRLLADLDGDPALAGIDAVVVRPAPDGVGGGATVVADLAAALTPDDAAAAGDLERALRAALGRLGARPVLLAIEDVERLDATGQAALAPALALARELPLLVVLTAPPAAAGPLPDAARALGERYAEIALGPLAPADAERLLDALAPGDALDPAARALLRERAGGHPGRIAVGVHLAPALAAERAQGDRAERSADAERRRATILFADISGFTAMTERLGAETAYPIVAGCLELLDGIARAHGGHVEKHLGDCVMATFGVPEAIEDAPRAAVNAAIEMRARVRAYNDERGLDPPLALHAGIHTGLGIAGDVSGPLLREFAVMGEPVDVASQLTDRAEAGQIFVGPDTERLVRGAFAFAPLGALALPGHPAPVEAFELRSERVRLHRERVGAGRRVFSALVGRDPELAALRARLAALAGGRGGVVSLRAEAGLGKSRLVAEMAASPEAAGVERLEGRSLSTGRSLRFHPFADLLRSWAGIGDADDEPAMHARLAALVARLLPDEVDDTTPLLASLLGLRLDGAARARIERIAGDALEQLLRRAVTQLLLRAAAERPALVVLDDLHWADDSSLELLSALVPLAAANPILFVLVARPGYAETAGRVEQAAREAGIEPLALRLAPLSRGAARELLANLFATDALPHATRAAIEEKAQGNPFFLEEVVRTLVDEGAVVREDGRFRATDRIHEVAIPDTLHELVTARVDRLPPRRRTLLQTASVIGRSFHERVLAGVAGDPRSVSDELGALAAGEFVVPWDQTGGVEWAFAHPLLHEVTYDGLLETRREELHRAVAAAIEAHLPAEVPGRAGMLAWHYGKGGAAERAEEHLFRAGEDAARVAASSEALQFFQEASKLYLRRHGEGGDPAKKARLAHHVALALFHRGRLLEADEHFQQALGHLGVRVPRGNARMAAAFASDALEVLAHLLLPARIVARPATDVDREIIAIMYERAQTQTTASPTRFVFDSVATLARLGRIDPSTVPGAGGMYAGAVGIFSYGGVSFALGRRFLERARTLLRADDVPERVHYAMMRQLHHLLAGDWSEEHVAGDELLEDGLRYGRLWEVTNALNLEGLRRLYRGDWDGAATCGERLGKIAEQYRHDLAASAQRFLAAMLRLERRDLAGAIAALDEYLDEHAEPAFQVSALGHRAVAQWLAGDPDAARASLARAERHGAAGERLLPYHMGDFLRARQLADALALAEPGAGAAARRRAARSRRSALRAASRVAWRRPEVLRTAGTEAWLLGRPEAARAWWAKSLACAEQLGMRPEAARTRLEMGRRLAAAGGRDEAAPLLAAARDAFAALALAGERDAAAEALA